MESYSPGEFWAWREPGSVCVHIHADTHTSWKTGISIPALADPHTKLCDTREPFNLSEIYYLIYGLKKKTYGVLTKFIL